MPARAAICAMVTDRRPCSGRRSATASRIASCTARRWASIDSSHSLGTARAYVVDTSSIGVDRVSRKAEASMSARADRPAVPGWVRMAGVVVVLLLIAVAVLLLTGHGPGRHLG